METIPLLELSFRWQTKKDAPTEELWAHESLLNPGLRVTVRLSQGAISSEQPVFENTVALHWCIRTSCTQQASDSQGFVWYSFTNLKGLLVDFRVSGMRRLHSSVEEWVYSASVFSDSFLCLSKGSDDSSVLGNCANVLFYSCLPFSSNTYM